MPGREILLARTSAEVVRYLSAVPRASSQLLGERARRRVLEEHTGEKRAEELETWIMEVMGRPSHRQESRNGHLQPCLPSSVPASAPETL